MNTRLTQWTISGAVVLALTAGSAVGQVAWRAGAEGAFEVRMQPGAITQTMTEMAARKDASRIVVQFETPVTAAQRGMLKEAGVDLLAPLGNNAFFANLNADVDVQRVSQAAAVSSVRSIKRSWKLAAAYEAGEIPHHAVVDALGDAGDGSDPIVAAYVMFHRDVDLAAGRNLMAEYDAFIRDELETVNSLVIELPVSKIKPLASNDLVQWLEPPLPKWGPSNDSNRARTGVDTVQAAPYNLNGNGVRAMIYDSGTALSSHQDFQTLQSPRVRVRDTSGLSFHATHVAGTVGASGALSGGQYKGMAPAVIMDSYGFEWSGSDIFLYQNPGDMEADYTEAITVHGSDISNNSIGTNVASNGFDCNIHGDYGITSTVIDGLVRGSLGEPFRIVWANGNERGNGRCGTSYGTTAPPSTAKNHCSVGALNSNDDSVTSFTSWGPTDDGRLKPDVSAPGCQSDDDGGVTSTMSDGGYATFCGTSMASPTVCGLGVLMLQDFRNHYPGQPDFRNSTLRAMLAHNALDVENPGPDYKTGYGSVRIVETIDFLRAGNFLESSVDQGSAFSAVVNVAPGASEFKVTIAWDDVPGTPNTSPSLVNDLDLVVTDPGGTQHHVWTLDPGNPGADAVRTQADRINNIEQVMVSNPQAGNWTVEIVGFNVPEGPQPFSVMASGSLTAMSLGLETGAPEIVAPGDSTTITARIDTINQSISGTPSLFYRFDGGTFLSSPLADLGGGLFEGTIPGANCDDTPEFYLAATGSVTGAATDPPAAPADTYTFTIGEETIPFEDDMETDKGWTGGVAGDTATTGIWTRVDPNGTAAQPEDDHTDGFAFTCWVTGQGSIGGGLGENDVDGGFTTLVSPVIDLSSASDATISYWRWYSNNTGGEPNADTMSIDISNNGGSSWTNVETLGPSGPDTIGGWRFFEFNVADFVTPTSQVLMRFIASDLGGGSLVEAAIDDFMVSTFGCTPITPQCEGDLNGSGTVDFDDLNIVLGNWGLTGTATPATGDANGDGDVNFDDLNVILGQWAMTCN